MYPRLGRRRIPNRGRENNRIVQCTRQGFFASHHIWFVHDVIFSWQLMAQLHRPRSERT
jgi:hypothetical protein